MADTLRPGEGQPFDPSSRIFDKPYPSRCRRLNKDRQLGGCVIGAYASAEPLFAAIAASRLPILLIDADQPGGRIVHSNQAICSLTGYAEEELLGRDLAMLHAPGSDKDALASLGTAIGSATPIAIELEIRRKDGSHFTSSLFVNPLRGPDGGLRYLFCSLLEIAGHAGSPGATRAGLDDLSKLARSVGHEFNNMLTIIHSNLELLRHAPADAVAGKRLDRIALGVERTTELIRGFIAKVRGIGPRPTSEAPQGQEKASVVVTDPDDVLNRKPQ